jgi:succinoglycan biosynthesis protein ExoA
MDPNAEPGSNHQPSLAIVMPIRNEAGHVDRALDAIEAQSYPADRIEIVVVDGGSTDGTLDAVRAHVARDGRLRILGGATVNTPLAMNLGIDATDAPFVAKIDGHGWINEPYLAIAIGELTSDDRLGCVGGRVVPEATTRVEQAIAHARFSILGVGGGVYTLDARTQLAETVQCGVYRRQALVDAGPFDPELQYGEDEELNHRLRAAGWGILMNPGMRFTYRVRSSIGALFRQYFRYGRARVAVIRKHPAFFRLKHAVPAAVLVTLLVSAALAVVVPPRWPFLLPWVVYSATVAVGATVLAVRHRFSRADLIALSLAALHLGYGLGTMRGLADRRPRPSP